MNRIGHTILFLLLALRISAQDLTVQQYIDRYKDLAMQEMKRVGVPASITLAQGILESENGNGELVKKSNNHFGIKCKSSWTGGTVYYNDDEEGECFRKYDSPEESFTDHSDFLKNSDRYSRLFSLDADDYKSWCYGLKRAGYATNPRYPEVLIKYIEKYNLQQYSMVVLSNSNSSDISAAGKNSGASVIPNSFDFPPAVNQKTNFNGIKAVFASQGTSLLALASRFNLSLSKLLEYNDLSADGLLNEDQYVYLERKNKEGIRDFHTVTEGESLYDISQANAVQLASLLQFNNLSATDKLNAGDLIYLKSTFVKLQDQVVKQQKNTDKIDAPIIVHEVQPKEGLYAISRKYNVTVDELKEWNNLSSESLMVGQQLIISKK